MKNSNLGKRAHLLNQPNVPIRPKKRIWGNPCVTTLDRKQIIHLELLEKKLRSFNEAFVKASTSK
jgi:hypothetical protein